MDILAGSFEVAEEKEAVLHERAAKGAAELIAQQGGLVWLTGQRIGRGGEGANGIENGIPKILVGFAVKFIGPAADTDIDDASGGVTILCTVVVGFDAKFIDGIRGGRNGLIRKALV